MNSASVEAVAVIRAGGEAGGAAPVNVRDLKSGLQVLGGQESY